MKILILSLSCLLIGLSQATAQTQYAFRVSFADKKATTADIAKPATFLSARALARRAAQSVAVDSSDLPVALPYIDTVLQLTNGILHTRSRWQNNCTILVTDTASINLVRSKAFVKNVQYTAIFPTPLHLFKGLGPAGETDMHHENDLFRTTGGPGYYGDAYDQIKLANGDYLHGKGYRGNGMLIAVLDAGFYPVNTLSGFDSLRLSGRLVDAYNFNQDTTFIYGYSSHGTEVLSTMAGIKTGDYVGTAPDASYALYVTEDGPSEQPYEMDNLVAAMERADSVGADVITISLGYNTFAIGTRNADLSLADIDGKSTVAARGANTATEKGMLVVASAGNDGGTSWAKILTPGDADSALTCGSVDINKKRAATSGKGPNAAGVRKPDVCMLGAPGVVLNNAGTTSSVNGTSIATPELAGLAACLWQTNPKATPYQLRKAIRESAHIATAPDNELGYGVPDFGKASLSIIDTMPDTLDGKLLVAPNPFRDKVSLRLYRNANGMYTWTLYDVQGRALQQGSRQKNSLMMEFAVPVPADAPAGLYFLRLAAEDFVQVVRLQKL